MRSSKDYLLSLLPILLLAVILVNIELVLKSSSDCKQVIWLSSVLLSLSGKKISYKSVSCILRVIKSSHFELLLR